MNYQNRIDHVQGQHVEMLLHPVVCVLCCVFIDDAVVQGKTQAVSKNQRRCTADSY
jgi:hypothetical protein